MNHLSFATLLKGTALALFLSVCMPANAQKADSKQISDLFAEVKEHAMLAEDDAQTLEAYTRSNISWQSHADRLRQVKEHVNDLLADYNQMVRLREEGSPWQQEAIDQLSPLTKSMANHLTATIEHQRANPTHVKMAPWVDYVHGNSEYVTKASTLIHDLVDYGAAKSTAESLERRLSLPADKE